LPDPDGQRVWKTKLPTKVKFFGWLLHHGRLNSRDYLYHRHIRELSEAYCEQCPLILETDTHILLECPAAMAIWQLIGIDPHPEEFRLPWLLGRELQLPSTVHTDVVLLLLWHIWKARNALIFDLVSS
jgi:hypothetical protein